MSRSRKRHPVVATTTATSEKEDKQRESRRRRHQVRVELLQSVHAVEPEAALSPDPRRSGSREFAKDGKAWVSSEDDQRAIERLRK